MDHLPLRVARYFSMIAVFLMALETTSRIEDWVRYRTPFFTRFRSQDDLIIRGTDGVHGRPNSQFQKWKMNSLGMRGPEVPPFPAAGTLRVVVVGASESFGLYEAEGKEYPRQLEDSLQRVLAAGACDGTAIRSAEVLNAAMHGMTVPTIEQDVRNRIRRIGADVVLVYPSPTQYLYEKRPAAARPDSSGRFKEPPISRAFYPRIYGRFRNQLKEMLPEFAKTYLRKRQTAAVVRRHPASWRFTQVPRDRVKAYEEDLRTLVGTIRRIGAHPVLVTHAHPFAPGGSIDWHRLHAWEKFYQRSTGETLIAYDSEASDAMLRVSSDSGVTAVDVQRLLHQRGGDLPSLFADHAHFTDEGAAVVGGMLKDGILRTVCPKLHENGRLRDSGA